MKQIPLTKEKFAIVDDEDYPVLSRFKWRLGIQKTIYSGEILSAVRAIINNRHTGQKEKHFDYPMEYHILPQKQNMILLHKNRNWLDFRKENLFYETSNFLKHWNTKIKGKTSIYKGVSNSVKGSKLRPWRGMITKRISGKRVCFRESFTTEIEAASWYNKKAFELYGEYAYQNKI